MFKTAQARHFKLIGIYCFPWTDFRDLVLILPEAATGGVL